MQPHLSAEPQDRLVIFSCCVAELSVPQQRNLPKAGDALEQLVALRVHRPAQLGVLLLDLQHLVTGLLTQLCTRMGNKRTVSVDRVLDRASVHAP